jgi:transmembrane sensor
MGNFQHSENIKNVILMTAARFSVPNGKTCAEAWVQFEKTALFHIAEAKQVHFESATYLKLAASLLIFLLASFSVYTLSRVQVTTARGEQRRIELPDHSMVILNAASALQFNRLAFWFTRKIKFDGEGFFSVQKGSAFEVISNHGATQVLGTQFNVVARGEHYEVTCVEGKVSVSTEKASVVLAAGQQTRSVRQQELLPPQSLKDDVTAWQRGEFYFENAPLNQVLGTLELQYNITIHFTGDITRVYTGYFTNQNLDEALKLVCLPLQLKYTVDNKEEVTISNQ